MNAAARAGITLLGAVASFVTMFGLCAWAGAQPQPAIGAAILAIALGRRDGTPSLAHAAAGALRLAAIALAAAGVGLLLHASPVAGAAVFVVALALSVWLRNFGPRWRAIGTVIALPLVALLVLPGGPAHARGGPLADLALVIAGGLVAYAFATAAQLLLRRAGAPGAAPADEARSERKPRAGVPVPTRMALQLATALTAAFAAGFAFFPGHAGWAVLTAYIVCAGARGRGDAFYKAVLRLGGALAGTVAALLVTSWWAPSGVAEAIVVFAVLYLGLWLRDRNYAYWAAAMTLIFALLSRTGGPLTADAFAVRLEAILAGAVCGVAAAWFVLPIRTEAVIRRYLADVLVAFDEVIAHAHLADAEHPRRVAQFERRLAELDRIAPPVRWHRRVFRSRADHPAGWIDAAGALRPHARAVEAAAKRGAIRRAIGVSRRAIATHGAADASPERVAIGDALATLHGTLGDG